VEIWGRTKNAENRNDYSNENMTIHSIPQIGSVLRNAVAFNFKNSPEVIMKADSLLAQVEQLINLLESRKANYAGRRNCFADLR
jgi:hypothetical protein